MLDLCRDARPHAGDGRVVHGGPCEREAHRVPGASEVFVGGVVSYSNDAKRRLLGVPRGDPARARRGLGRDRGRDGARRARGARCRCSGRRHRSRGPGRGDAGEAGRTRLPARRGSGPEAALRLELPGDREAVQTRSAASVLHLLRRVLTQSDTHTRDSRRLASWAMSESASSARSPFRRMSSRTSFAGRRRALRRRRGPPRGPGEPARHPRFPGEHACRSRRRGRRLAQRGARAGRGADRASRSWSTARPGVSGCSSSRTRAAGLRLSPSGSRPASSASACIGRRNGPGWRTSLCFASGRRPRLGPRSARPRRGQSVRSGSLSFRAAARRGAVRIVESVALGG